MPQRPVYLLVYNSRLFAAHWAMWIPVYNAKTKDIRSVGKLINVQGDPGNGFTHQFVRNHDMSIDLHQKEVIFMGRIDESNIRDGINQGQPYEDAEAIDVIEEWALSIEAPGPSLRSASSSSLGPRSRVKLENCQTWMASFVAALVENGILDEQANTIVAEAPKN